MPKVKPDELSEIARDALYVAVGLGILGFQKLQERRRALEKRSSSSVPRGAPRRASSARFPGTSSASPESPRTSASSAG
jgi:hypothetical protein